MRKKPDRSGPVTLRFGEKTAERGRRTQPISLLVLGVFGVFLAGCSSDDKKPTTPEAIDFPAAYVVNSGSNSISVINLRTNEVARTIGLPGVSWPHHIYLSADGSTAAVSVPGMDLSQGHSTGGMGMNGAVIMMDCATGRVENPMMMEAMNHNAVFSPDGNEIWTAMMMDSASGMNFCMVFDRSMAHRMAEIRVGEVPEEVTFSRDGRHAFVCNNKSGTVTMIDATSKAVLETITVGSGPVGAWPGVDGRMYVDNEDSETISIIDPMMRTVVQTIDLGFMPGYAATPPSLTELWVSDPDGAKVHYYDRETGDHLGFIAVGDGAHAIGFTSDGASAIVTNQLAGNVSVIDVLGHRVVKTIAVGVKPNGLVVRDL